MIRPIPSILIACIAGLLPTSGQTTIPVQITVDASKPTGDWKPIWRFFGADEPNYATMTDGRSLLGELGELKPDAVYFRTHNLLTSGDGTPALKWGSTGVYGEDGQGRRWSTVGVSANIVDASFEALLDAIQWKLIRDFGTPA